MQIATTPLFICDAFAEERFKGNAAAVLMVPTSVYCMEWSAMNSLEASFGRGEPEESTHQTEEERERTALNYAEDRDTKMGRAFQQVAAEMHLSGTAFVYRLPASRVRLIQEKIKRKVDEFETEYEEKCKLEEDSRRMSAMLVDDEPRSTLADAHAKEGEEAAKHTDAMVGLIPSTSFNVGTFCASFLDTRGASSMLGISSTTNRGPRRLHTQWFGLRWFTPILEMKLCAHATIAAAHAIFESSRLCHFLSTRHLVDNVPVEFFIPAQTDVLCFVTAAGIISVRRKDKEENPYALTRDSTTAVESYEVHLPANEAVSIAQKIPPSFKTTIANALGLPDDSVVGDIALSARDGIYVVELTSAQAVCQCRPEEHLVRAAFKTEDFAAARKKDNSLVNPHGLVVTAENHNALRHGQSENSDIVSRYFSPWVGVMEDSGTGTAHTVITPYWLRRRQNGVYRVGDRLECYQASARGGRLTSIIIGKKADRIALIGSVVTFLRGDSTFTVEE